MKRLIFAITLLAAVSAQASPIEIPTSMPGYSFRGFSPNGEWAVSDDSSHSPLVILNLTTGKQFTYSENYANGNGNFISDTGVVVGSIFEADKAAYWENGEWQLLPVPAGTAMSFANGITPDGKMIVGSMSPSDYTNDFENTMLMPCFWLRNSDGSYSDATVLPHPVRDFSNRRPQYVTALIVSTDGKNIAGQMLDYSGRATQIVLYRLGENGEWSYTLPADFLFHPVEIEFPPYPGDGPSQQEFMTPEELELYNRAVLQWELSGNANGEPYPDASLFMTEEEYLEYLEADMAWAELYSKFMDAFIVVIERIPHFKFNNLYMTSDASMLATTDSFRHIDEVQGLRIINDTPYLIDLAQNTARAIENENLNVTVSGVLDDGAVLGQTLDLDYRIFNGYILKAGASEFIPIYDLVKEVDPATAQWMEVNMTHDYLAYNPDTDEIYTDTILATGVPYSNANGTILGFGQYVFWDENEASYGYLINLPEGAGVKGVSNNANLDNSLKVFNLQGVKILETKDASLINSLPKGIYIVNGKKFAIN